MFLSFHEDEARSTSESFVKEIKSTQEALVDDNSHDSVQVALYDQQVILFQQMLAEVDVAPSGKACSDFEVATAKCKKAFKAARTAFSNTGDMKKHQADMRTATQVCQVAAQDAAAKCKTQMRKTKFDAEQSLDSEYTKKHDAMATTMSKKKAKLQSIVQQAHHRAKKVTQQAQKKAATTMSKATIAASQLRKPLPNKLQKGTTQMLAMLKEEAEQKQSIMKKSMGAQHQLVHEMQKTEVKKLWSEAKTQVREYEQMAQAAKLSSKRAKTSTAAQQKQAWDSVKALQQHLQGKESKQVGEIEAKTNQAIADAAKISATAKSSETSSNSDLVKKVLEAAAEAQKATASSSNTQITEEKASSTKSVLNEAAAFKLANVNTEKAMLDAAAGGYSLLEESAMSTKGPAGSNSITPEQAWDKVVTAHEFSNTMTDAERKAAEIAREKSLHGEWGPMPLDPLSSVESNGDSDTNPGLSHFSRALNQATYSSSYAVAHAEDHEKMPVPDKHEDHHYSSAAVYEQPLITPAPTSAHTAAPTVAPTAAPTVAPTAAPTMPLLLQWELLDTTKDKIWRIAYDAAQVKTGKLVIAEDAASLLEDADEAAASATSGIISAAIKALTAKAAIVMPANDKLQIQLQQRLVHAAKHIVRNAAREAVDRLITGAAARRMAELPIGTAGAGAAIKRAAANTDAQWFPNTENRDPQVAKILTSSKNSKFLKWMLKGSHKGSDKGSDKVVAEKSDKSAVLLQEDSAESSDTDHISSLLRTLHNEQENLVASSHEHENSASAADMTQGRQGEDASKGGAIKALEKTLHKAQSKLHDVVKKKPIATHVAASIQRKVNKQVLKHETQKRVQAAQGNPAKLVRLQEKAISEAAKARSKIIVPLERSAAILKAQVAAAKEKLKATAWLARLKQKSSESLKSTRLAIKTTHKHLKKKTSKLKRKIKAMKKSYKEKLQQVRAERQITIKREENKANNAEFLLKKLKTTMKAKIVEKENEIDQLKATHRAAIKTLQMKLTAEKAALAKVMHNDNKNSAQKMQMLQRRTAIKMNNMRRTWHAKEEAMKAKYALALAEEVP
jgi:hypothetical protein